MIGIGFEGLWCIRKTQSCFPFASCQRVIQPANLSVTQISTAQFPFYFLIKFKFTFA